MIFYRSLAELYRPKLCLLWLPTWILLVNYYIIMVLSCDDCQQPYKGYMSLTVTEFSGAWCLLLYYNLLGGCHLVPQLSHLLLLFCFSSSPSRYMPWRFSSVFLIFHPMPSFSCWVVSISVLTQFVPSLPTLRQREYNVTPQIYGSPSCLQLTWFPSFFVLRLLCHFTG